MRCVRGALAFFVFLSSMVHAEEVYDESRDRMIPVELSYPKAHAHCTSEHKCPVAFLSAGYGVSHTDYAFLSSQLAGLGYLVVAIGHELPQDPPLSVKGNLYETRSENWLRGAVTLDFLKNKLQPRFQHYDFERLTLLGHSNGGDISAWLGNEAKPYIQTIITFDHRRVPLPRTVSINILSVRGSDFPADQGVLPTEKELSVYGDCIVSIPESKHNDMSDHGPVWLKEKMSDIVTGYLNGASCDELRKLNG